MKGKEFVNLLRKIIREEVSTVVKEELKAIKPLLAEYKTKNTQQSTRPPVQTVNRKPIVNIDGALGDILRETADSMYNNSQQYEEWPDMNGGPMTSDFAMGDGDGFMPQPPVSPSFMSNDPTAVFMKDYSKVLKQADNIAQGFRGAE